MKNQVYIHYGAKEFDPTINFPIKNEHLWVKPSGSLWASRIDSKFGWKHWCEVEDFRDCDINNSFKFTLKPESKIITISTLETLKKLPPMVPYTGESIFSRYYIDFEKCLISGIDAIELYYFETGYIPDRGDLYNALYGWDCDSIVILNPDVVSVIK